MNFKAEAEDIHSDNVTAFLLKETARPAGLLK
jgi:hypothetical protein